MESSGRPQALPVTLPERVRVVNVGLPMFAESVLAQGAEAIDVAWRIPAGGRPESVDARGRELGRRAGAIDEANAEGGRRNDPAAPLRRAGGAARDEVPQKGDPS